MIELLTGLPERVVGFHATGEVDADDYHRVLEPTIDKAPAGEGKLSLLYVLDDDVTYSAGAGWQDAVTAGEQTAALEWLTAPD